MVLPAAQSKLIRESARCVTQYPVYSATREGSSLAWNIPFIEAARFGASTSRRCIAVPDKECSAAARTYICEKGLWKDSLPAAYNPFIGVRRGRKCLASGPRGEVRL